MQFEAIHICHWQTQMTTMAPDIEIVPRQQNGGALDFWGSPSRHLNGPKLGCFGNRISGNLQNKQLGTLVQLKHSISSMLRRLSHIFSSLHLVSGYVFDCRLRRSHKAQFLAILEVPDLDPHFSEWCLAMPLESTRSKLSGGFVGQFQAQALSITMVIFATCIQFEDQISNLGFI